MEASGCSLDASTYAKSGRLDAALRLFEEMKTRDSGGRPGLGIYSALVDSMGKARRLDAAMRLYREMQVYKYKPSVQMYVSMIESLVKAGKLDAGTKLWDEMNGAGFHPNFDLYTMMVETQARFRKRMLCYDVVPRRIKLVPGPTLKMVVAQMLESVGSPFEVSKVVLRAPGDSVLEWFKKLIVQQFLLNEIPSKADVLMHKLNVLFPSSGPEVRSLSPPKSPAMSR
ncbi:hypothetical protein COCNU_scaffold004112G000020 [Cocos nucifera]|nr:hypothetical protein [Cocos nucifera]